MAFKPVPKTIKIELQWIGAAGGDAYDILYFAYSNGPPSSADMLAVATLVKNAANSNLTGQLSNTRSIGTVTATDLDTATGYSATFGTPAAGTKSGAQLPGNTTVLINGKLQVRYKGGKPRVYPPLLAGPDLQSAAEWAPTAVQAVQQAWQSFINAIQGQPAGSLVMGSWVCVQRWADKVELPTPVPRPIVSYQVSSIPGTQRRRMRAG